MSNETKENEENTPTGPKQGAIVDVTMHPLVLLSAADHYHRVARGTRKRVVGVLLGQVFRGKVDATNSFAVPFEEDSKNPVSCMHACMHKGSLTCSMPHSLLFLSLYRHRRSFI